MHESWAAFWSMGGYASYVWSSYGIAAVVILGNVLAPILGHRRLVRRIRNGEFDD